MEKNSRKRNQQTMEDKRREKRENGDFWMHFKIHIRIHTIPNKYSHNRSHEYIKIFDPCFHIAPL